jgi:hypothetical protein
VPAFYASVELPSAFTPAGAVRATIRLWDFLLESATKYPLLGYFRSNAPRVFIYKTAERI